MHTQVEEAESDLEAELAAFDAKAGAGGGGGEAVADKEVLYILTPCPPLSDTINVSLSHHNPHFPAP
jgi:hypothetical protein